MTVVGTDSVSGIVVEIFASDYAIISKDTSVALTFTFHNEKSAASYSKDFDIELLWVDVCTLVEYESYLSLNSLTDITHSVLTQASNSA